jgi:cytoplasmic tRNA 2-thiolation protein 1
MNQPLPTIEHFSAIKRDDAAPDMILPKDPALVHTPPPRVPTGIINDQQKQQNGKKDLTW